MNKTIDSFINKKGSRNHAESLNRECSTHDANHSHSETSTPHGVSSLIESRPTKTPREEKMDNDASSIVCDPWTASTYMELLVNQRANIGQACLKAGPDLPTSLNSLKYVHENVY